MTVCLLTLRTKSSKNEVNSKKKEFAPTEAFFFLELTPDKMGDKNENDSIASSARARITLNIDNTNKPL